ncbi:MAG: ParB/RepB/Spo0J family partition protein [Undibacterium sp.]|nr:ParB/RepB/Spo0J family partition protein [Opitutaceae bacterium]
MQSIATLKVGLLAVDLIDESPLNPRKQFAKLTELADSLRAGQFEPIIVRRHPTAAGRYELANGARRLRAARVGDIKELAGKVAELSDAQMFDIILGTGAEGNVASLTFFEEGEGYVKAMATLGLTLEQCAQRFGRPVTTVQMRVALLAVLPAVRKAVESGELVPTVAWLIARIPGAEQQRAAAMAVLHPEGTLGPLSLRATEALIKHSFSQTLTGAEFDPKLADLVPAAGACTACPHRAGNNPGTYGDADGTGKLVVRAPNTCMRPACYQEKLIAHRARRTAKEVEKGHVVLSAEENERTFPKGEKGIAWNADYVELNRPPAVDLVKAEVVAVPMWKDLCNGEDVSVVVHVGFDQAGRTVDLVKLDEALAAAIENDEAGIFRPEVIKKNAAPKAKGHAAPKPAGEPSIRQSERVRTAEDRAAEKAKLQREKLAREWLTDLGNVLEKDSALTGKPLTENYSYWSLVWELALAALTEEDLEFLAGVGLAWYVPDGGARREQFKFYAGTLPWRELASLATLVLLTPRVRAEGTESALVREWHGTLVEPLWRALVEEAAATPEPTP